MNYNQMKNKTHQKFESLDFKPGDIFSEMLSNWKVIIGVEGDNLIVIQGPNSNLELKNFTKEEFKNLCKYKHSDGYWIDFMKNNPDRIKDYVQEFISQQSWDLDKVREFKLDLVL